MWDIFKSNTEECESVEKIIDSDRVKNFILYNKFKNVIEHIFVFCIRE